MAITRAQQFRQMLEDGGMLVKPGIGGRRPGYRGDDAYGGRASTSRSSSSSSSGSGNKSGGSGNKSGGGGGSNFSGGDDRRESYITDYSSKAKVKGGGKQKPFRPGGGPGDQDYEDFQYTSEKNPILAEKMRRDRGLSTLNILRAGVPSANTPSMFANTVLNAFAPFRNYSLRKNIDFFQYSPKTTKARAKYGLTADGYSEYMKDRLAGKIDAAGNIAAGFMEGPRGEIIPTGNDGRDSEAEQLALLAQNQIPQNTTPTTTDSPLGGLGFRFLAEGGMAEDAPVGGIMDIESGRQMYFLGKLVKKATRAVKKIAKSPIGKAALLYAGGAGLGSLASGGGLGSLFKLGTYAPSTVAANFPKIFSGTGLKNILVGGKGASLGGNRGMGAGIIPEFSGLFGKGGELSFGKVATFASLLPLLGLGTGDESEEEAEKIIRGSGLDIASIRNTPYTFRSSVGEGRGLATAFLAEGGKAEPVAKETMPLLKMGGKEMDLRDDGGFVPIGRMERADDVPARLSKNEFVFTADAVRNAGGGDIDKGAEVMYNMMQNLESGGEVSEESQGLKGAREMFQTSKRLEEVL